MATTLFGQAYASFLALGVGGLGGRAAAAGCLDGFGERMPWAACDTQAARLLATGLERKLRLDLPRAFRPEFVERSLEAQGEPLRRLLRKKELVILFGALDEPDTLPLCAALGGHLRREKRRVCTIGLEPFPGKAGVTPERLDGSELFLRLSSAAREVDLEPGTPAARFARLGEEALSSAVEALLAVWVGCESAPGFSFDELREFLRGASVPSAVGASQGREAAVEAVERALSCGRQAEGGGVAIAIAAGREFSWAEVQGIRSRLEKAFGAGTALLLGFGTDPALANDARCLLMCRPVASPNVVPLNSGQKRQDP